MGAFNGLEYIASYNDLIGAFGPNKAAGEFHFNNFGRAEGRLVSFNALEYIASYADLSAAFGTVSTFSLVAAVTVMFAVMPGFNFMSGLGTPTITL